MTFKGRIALITGGSSGIGAATARTLAHRGARVFVASLTPPAEGTFDSDRISFIPCDVTHDAAVRSMLEQIEAQAGKLDLAVNAAGYEGALSPLHQYPMDDARKVLEVNLVGVFLSLKCELDAMRSAGGGAIVNLASIAGLRGIPNAAAYTASKHGVVGLTRVAALESADVPIRVNAVCPALVDTPMADRLSEKAGMSKSDFASANPMGRAANAAEVAETVCWLLSDEASFVSGQTLGVDGAQTAA